MLENPTKQDRITVKNDGDVQCNSSHFSHLYNQLSIHAAEWREIGTHLGFTQDELKTISFMPFELMEAPKSWLRTMLSQWLQWAPGDRRKSKQYATLEALKTAVCKTNAVLCYDPTYILDHAWCLQSVRGLC